MAEFLNIKEHERRQELGIRDFPHPANIDQVFWKETLQGRKVATQEGTVFSEEEFIKILQEFDPTISPQAKIIAHLYLVKEHLKRRKIITYSKLIFNKPVGMLVAQRVVPRGLVLALTSAITIFVPMFWVDAIMDTASVMWFYFGIKGVYHNVISQRRVINELIPLVENFIFQDSIADRQKIFEQMAVLIPKIENLKPGFILDAIDDALEMQPLPIEFNERLMELRELMISRYNLDEDQNNHNTLDGNEAMISAPGGIDLSNNNYNIIEYGQDIHMDFDDKAYDYVDPAKIIGIQPIIVSVVQENIKAVSP